MMEIYLVWIIILCTMQNLLFFLNVLKVGKGFPPLLELPTSGQEFSTHLLIIITVKCDMQGFRMIYI